MEFLCPHQGRDRGVSMPVLARTYVYERCRCRRNSAIFFHSVAICVSYGTDDYHFQPLINNSSCAACLCSVSLLSWIHSNLTHNKFGYELNFLPHQIMEAKKTVNSGEPRFGDCLCCVVLIWISLPGKAWCLHITDGVPGCRLSNPQLSGGSQPHIWVPSVETEVPCELLEFCHGDGIKCK